MDTVRTKKKIWKVGRIVTLTNHYTANFHLSHTWYRILHIEALTQSNLTISWEKSSPSLEGWGSRGNARTVPSHPRWTAREEGLSGSDTWRSWHWNTSFVNGRCKRSKGWELCEYRYRLVFWDQNNITNSEKINLDQIDTKEMKQKCESRFSSGRKNNFRYKHDLIKE